MTVLSQKRQDDCRNLLPCCAAAETLPFFYAQVAGGEELPQ
jgi:hypothetical protein